ncbi:MAG: hypothetical protein ACI8ZM_005713 [Crocinitomix sp.]
MTVIEPFKAIRPTRDKAYLVATRPSYAYNKEVLHAKLNHNPYTFLHVINPEFHTDDKTKPNTPERFQKIRNKFVEFINEGIFIREEKESFYLYRQTVDGHAYVGLIAGASVDQYNSGHIKKHEETITERETVFSNYLKIVEFNVEPVLLFHRKHEALNQLLAPLMFARPEYEFTSWDRGKHEIWIVKTPETIEKIQNYYKEIEDIYIADGHHRCASSARYSNSIRNKTSKSQDLFLACFISEEKLKIFDYNRLVKDLNGLSSKKFLEGISKSFIITTVLHEDAAPSGLHEISMYLEKQWYKLTAKEGTFDRNHAVHKLDTDILTKNILNPILDLFDLKTNERVSFINGKKGMIGIEDAVEEERAKVGFGLFPVSVTDLKRVSNENLIMPPKSTWIEPKLRSGLTIFPLDE